MVDNAGINGFHVPLDLLGGYLESDQALPPLLPGIGPRITVWDLTDLKMSSCHRTLGIHLRDEPYAWFPIQSTTPHLLIRHTSFKILFKPPSDHFKSNFY